MKKYMFFATLTCVFFGLGACKSSYSIDSISRSRILIDNRYDTAIDSDLNTLMRPYKAKVDSIMSPFLGISQKAMEAHQPESELSNLLADIMVWGAKQYGETVDFGVYNMGGIRASLPKGRITYGDILEVAPFENKICFLTLTGSKVLQLFKEIAHNGGEGVSGGVRLVITKNGELKTAKLHGQEIDPNKNYRIATLDYVANANDKMNAFKAKTNLNAPQGEKNNTRFIIVDYIKEQTKENRPIDANIEGRIVIE
ncbi:MAG: 5'-nucleotidase [Prevotella sp.]|nr:5'-nucleotidase C-terminal domain-containing protein [Prevotella sp.]MDD7273053.1 5'-nucleotidase [Prevotellaceae bacterium]MDY3935750.1 5'-nucleotidase [Prevotella sp.]MDY4217704.1 5'-nucleotidase [Prevotella sp.]